jgi:hypothetical protein
LRAHIHYRPLGTVAPNMPDLRTIAEEVYCRQFDGPLSGK